MATDDAARLIPLPNRTAPSVAETAWVAPGAVLVGTVILAEGASVWYNAVVRADNEPITIGEGSNLQDNVSAHVDHGSPLAIGARVSVGHNAVLHGCTIEDEVLVGMHATVMNGAVIGTGSLIAAGALVTEGTVVPPRSLVTGVPGKVRRELSDDEVDDIRTNAAHYLELAALHAAAVSANAVRGRHSSP